MLIKYICITILKCKVSPEFEIKVCIQDPRDSGKRDPGQALLARGFISMSNLNDPPEWNIWPNARPDRGNGRRWNYSLLVSTGWAAVRRIRSRQSQKEKKREKGTVSEQPLSIRVLKPSSTSWSQKAGMQWLTGLWNLKREQNEND